MPDNARELLIINVVWVYCERCIGVLGGMLGENMFKSFVCTLPIGLMQKSQRDLRVCRLGGRFNVEPQYPVTNFIGAHYRGLP